MGRGMCSLLWIVALQHAEGRLHRQPARRRGVVREKVAEFLDLTILDEVKQNTRASTSISNVSIMVIWA